MAGGGGKGGGGGSTKVEVVNSGTTNVNSNSTLDIIGLDDVDVRTELVLPQPFRTESDSRNELAVTEPVRTELAVTEPIRTESTSDNALTLDVKPVVLDSCTRIEFGPIPPTRVRQPYHRHFGIKLFGIEVLAFTMTGEEQLIIQDLPKQAHVVHGGHHAHDGGKGARHQRRKDGESGRLRIRVT